MFSALCTFFGVGGAPAGIFEGVAVMPGIMESMILLPAAAQLTTLAISASAAPDQSQQPYYSKLHPY